MLTFDKGRRGWRKQRLVPRREHEAGSSVRRASSLRASALHTQGASVRVGECRWSPVVRRGPVHTRTLLHRHGCPSVACGTRLRRVACATQPLGRGATPERPFPGLSTRRHAQDRQEEDHQALGPRRCGRQQGSGQQGSLHRALQVLWHRYVAGASRCSGALAANHGCLVLLLVLPPL